MIRPKEPGVLEKLAQWYQKVRYECVHKNQRLSSNEGAAGEEPWLILTQLEQITREASDRTELVD